MKRYVAMLCGVAVLFPSVNTDAVENDSDAMVTTQSMAALDVGRRLHEHRLTEEFSPDASRASAERIAQPAHEPQPTELDLWLMALAGAGLIVLQLRRKQKSLPQRPLIPTDNQQRGEFPQRHAHAVMNFASHS